jgi:hypothetical protein
MPINGNTSSPQPLPPPSPHIPIAAIYFIPADAHDAPTHFETLRAQLPPPPLAARELALPPKDPMFVRFYVLLFDASAPGADATRCARRGGGGRGERGSGPRLSRPPRPPRGVGQAPPVAAGRGLTRSRLPSPETHGSAKTNLTLLQSVYGAANVALLTINSRAAALAAGAPDAPPPPPPDALRAPRRACLPGGGGGEPQSRPAEPPGGLGAGLAPADLAAAGQLLRDFTQACLLPKLEERISRLNLSVTAMRKGFKNRLTRLWKAGTGGDGGPGGGPGAPGGGGGGPAEPPPYVWHRCGRAARAAALRFGRVRQPRLLAVSRARRLAPLPSLNSSSLPNSRRAPPLQCGGPDAPAGGPLPAAGLPGVCGGHLQAGRAGGGGAGAVRGRARAFAAPPPSTALDPTLFDRVPAAPSTPQDYSAASHGKWYAGAEVRGHCRRGEALAGARGPCGRRAHPPSAQLQAVSG